MTASTRCGSYFPPKYANSRLCDSCWKKRENAFAEHDFLTAQVDRLDRRLWQLCRKQQQDIPPDILQLLLQLTHPDRHNGSEATIEATA